MRYSELKSRSVFVRDAFVFDYAFIFDDAFVFDDDDIASSS
jgi:hypothetical protein